ncbi:hypothetical protein ACFU41_20360 [Bacillus subtilis]
MGSSTWGGADTTGATGTVTGAKAVTAAAGLSWSGTVSLER